MTTPTTTGRARAALGLEPAGQPGTQLSPVDRLIAHTRNMEAQFRDAVASGLRPEQLVRDAITAVRSNDKLAQCDEASFFGALMTAGQLGLRPNVASLGHGWVLPYWDRKLNNGRGGLRAQWILGYQGMVELGYRSGLVQKLTAVTVYEGDPVWRVVRGTTDELHHEPAMDTERRGRAVAHYAVVWLSTGRALWEAIPDGEARRIMERFAARNKQNQIVGPWRDDYEAMARKTALRALWRWMPKTEVMSLALATDGAIRDGLDGEPVEAPEQTATITVVTPAPEPAAAPPVVVAQLPAEPPAATEPPAPAAAASDDDSAAAPAEAETFVVKSTGEVLDALDTNSLRRGLIGRIEANHGAGWTVVCEQLHGEVIPPRFLSTAQLRAIAEAPATP